MKRIKYKKHHLKTTHNMEKPSAKDISELVFTNYNRSPDTSVYGRRYSCSRCCCQDTCNPHHSLDDDRLRKELILMDEIYKLIEERIADGGYLKSVSGERIYNEICDFVESKDNGTYIFLSAHDDSAVIEYKLDIFTDDFNLSYIKITEEDKQYHINFDD